MDFHIPFPRLILLIYQLDPPAFPRRQMDAINHAIFLLLCSQKAVSLVLRGHNITFDVIVIISVRL